MISSGSLSPFRKLIIALGYLWLAGCALILSHLFGLLEILISSLGLHRADSLWAGVISVWSQQSFEGGTRAIISFLKGGKLPEEIINDTVFLLF